MNYENLLEIIYLIYKSFKNNLNDVLISNQLPAKYATQNNPNTEGTYLKNQSGQVTLQWNFRACSL